MNSQNQIMEESMAVFYSLLLINIPFSCGTCSIWTKDQSIWWWVWEQAEGSPYKALLVIHGVSALLNQWKIFLSGRSLVFPGLLISVVVLNGLLCLCIHRGQRGNQAKMYISELKNICRFLEQCEQRLIQRIQSPASSRTDRDVTRQCVVDCRTRGKPSEQDGCSKNAQAELLLPALSLTRMLCSVTWLLSVMWLHK